MKLRSSYYSSFFSSPSYFFLLSFSRFFFFLHSPSYTHTYINVPPLHYERTQRVKVQQSEYKFQLQDFYYRPIHFKKTMAEAHEAVAFSFTVGPEGKTNSLFCSLKLHRFFVFFFFSLSRVQCRCQLRCIQSACLFWFTFMETSLSTNIKFSI